MKRRILSLITAASMLLSLIVLPQTASAALSGSGTESDPYQISTTADLQALASAVNGGTDQSGVYFKLTADIDLTDITWDSIGVYSDTESGRKAFAGTFDGDGHSITNLTDKAQHDYYGLFGYNKGTIKNLAVTAYISNSSSKYAGAICAVNEGGTIEGCSAAHSGAGANTNEQTLIYGQNVGGICAKSIGGKISRCHTRGNISATSTYAGGIAAQISGGTEISDCYSVATPTNSKTSGSGGIVGCIESASTVKNCYFYVYNTSVKGAIVGLDNSGNESSTIQNNYYIEGSSASWKGVYGKDDADGAVKKLTADEFNTTDTANVFKGFDFEGIWERGVLYGRPILKGVPEAYHTHTMNADCDGSEPIIFENYYRDNEKTLYTNIAGQKKTSNYVLTKDITLSAPWYFYNSGTYNICLNGHTIKLDDSVKGPVFRLEGQNITLNICDCSEEHTGKITGGKGVGEIEEYDWNTNSYVTIYRNGCGIYMSNSSVTVNFYGGSITGNANPNEETALTKGDGTFYPHGGGVRVDAGTFNMYGGEISENTSGSYGGGISCSLGNVNIYGGAIKNNKAKYGGGIAAINNIDRTDDDDNTVNGYFPTVNAVNGEISKNSAETGGGIFIGESTNNTSVALGGTAAEDSVVVKNNTASSYGGGVAYDDIAYISDYGNPDAMASVFSLGKNVEISENKSGGETPVDDNVYIGADKQIKITDALTSKIGISLEQTQVFTDGWSAKMNSDAKVTDYFTLESDGYDNCTMGKRHMGDGIYEGILGYTVTYSKPDGVTGAAPTDSAIYLKNDTVPVSTEKPYTKSGYQQVGWSATSDSTTTVSEYTMTAANATLYPVFEREFTSEGESDTLNLTYNTAISTAIDLNDYVKFTDTTQTDNFSFALADGQSLPAGLTLDTTSGKITGTPTENVGDYTVSFTVTDNSPFKVFSLDPATATQTATLTLKFAVAKATPEYSVPTGLTAVIGKTLESVALPDGWTWSNGTASVGAIGNNEFTAVFTPSDTDNYNIVTETLTVTVEYATAETELKPGESVIREDETVEFNEDGTVTIDKGNDGTTDVTITVPDGTETVTVDENGNVTVPENGTVKVGDGEVITLPSGGTVNTDDTITVPTGGTVKVGNGEVITLPQGGTVNTDGTITVPAGGTVKVGDGEEITLPSGGTVDTSGNVSGEIVKVGDTTVTGTDDEDVTVNANGTITVPNGGTVKVGENGEVITLPNGGTVDTSGNVTAETVVIGGTTITAPADGDAKVTVGADGKAAISEGTTVTTTVDGKTTTIKVTSGSGTVDADGNVTLPNGGTVEINGIKKDVPAGGSVSPSDSTGDEVKPGGDPVENGGTTVTNKDGNVTVDNGSGSNITVTLPDSTDSVTVDDNGNVTVPDNSTVTVGGTTITLPDGGTVNKDGNTSGETVVIGDTTITAPDGETVTVDENGDVTVPENGTVQVGDNEEISLPDGGTVDKDGNTSGETVVIGDTTVTAPDGETVTTDKNGNTEVTSGAMVKKDDDVKITIDEGSGTVDKDGVITFPDGGKVTIEQGGTTATVDVEAGGTLNPSSLPTPTPAVKRSGSSGGTSSYKVTFDAGEYGEITSGKASVSVTYNAKLASASVPTVTAKEGYVFIGWSTDGKTVVDVTATAIKKATTFTALYEAAPTTEPQQTAEPSVTDKPALSGENPFTDVTSEFWYYEPILSAYADGLMEGVTNTEFAPLADITRGMFVTVLYRMEGEPETEIDYTFEDVATDAYYANAVAWGSANGIIQGYSAAQYAPEQIITREQMAAIIYRYAEYKAVDTSVSGGVSYADSADISDYARDAVAWNSANGILQGNTDNTFAPQNNATRAESAAVFERIAEKLK